MSIAHARAKIAKWGNSSGVRLPANLLHLTGLSVGTSVTISATARGFLIEPEAPRYTLDALLASYDPARHTHDEPDWGEDVGHEAMT